jgi:hypothetical protein
MFSERLWTKESSGIVELDEMMYGESKGVMGALVVYKQDKKHEHQTSKTLWSDVSNNLTPVSTDTVGLHRLSNLILYYEGLPCDLQVAFETLVAKLKSHNVLICAGLANDGNVVVLVKKLTYKRLPDLSISEQQPSMFQLPIKIGLLMPFGRLCKSSMVVQAKAFLHY